MLKGGRGRCGRRLCPAPKLEPGTVIFSKSMAEREERLRPQLSPSILLHLWSFLAPPTPPRRHLHALPALGHSMHHSALCPGAGCSRSYQRAPGTHLPAPPPSPELPPTCSRSVPDRRETEIMSEAPLSITMKKRSRVQLMSKRGRGLRG